MLIFELIKSFFREVGSDAGESALGHMLSLLAIAFYSMVDRKNEAYIVEIGTRNVNPNGGLTLIIPMGDVKRHNLAIVARAVRLVQGGEIRVTRSRPVDHRHFLPEKNSINGDMLLSTILDEEDLFDVGRIMVVTDQKISTEITENYVYGLAYTKQPIGIVSTSIESEKAVYKKMALAVVAIHELGHTYGLDHCSSDECVMKAMPVLVPTKTSFCKLCEQKMKGISDV